MVWFQCEDCGENLKKPKLPNHFRICSAGKLSCIDCGEIFGQQSVQGHTQCITEAEKYGPKGQGKASYGTPAKPSSETKQKPDVDINVGLSSHAPWFCSLCNTKATSRQALLLHAEGKKHRAKARAFHFANAPAKPAEESIPSTNGSTDNPPKEETLGNKDVEQPKEQDPPETNGVRHSLGAENGSLPLKKKRKLETSENGVAKVKEANSGDLNNGEVIQAEKEAEPSKFKAKKTKHGNVPEEEKKDKIVFAEEATIEKIKWKKLITSILKLKPDGVLKMRKLQKLVSKALQESGITNDEARLKDLVVQKINSSSRFIVEDKLVRLVAKS